MTGEEALRRQWRMPTGQSPFIGRVRGMIEVERLVEDEDAMESIINLIEELIRDVGAQLELIRNIEDKDVAREDFLAMEAQLRKQLGVSLTNEGLNRLMVYIEGRLEVIIEESMGGVQAIGKDDLVFIGFLTIIATSAAAVHKDRQSNLQSSIDDVVEEMSAISGGMF